MISIKCSLLVRLTQVSNFDVYLYFSILSFKVIAVAIPSIVYLVWRKERTQDQKDDKEEKEKRTNKEVNSEEDVKMRKAHLLQVNTRHNIKMDDFEICFAAFKWCGFECFDIDTVLPRL